MPVSGSVPNGACRHRCKGTSGELDNMQGRLAPGVSSATLGSLDMCGRRPRATKWHAHVFRGSSGLRVPSNELEGVKEG